MTPPRRVGLIVTLTALLLAQGARAALTNCAELSSNPGDYKVVLDDFAFSPQPGKSKVDIGALKDRLQFNLNGQLDALRIAATKLDKTLQVPMRLVFCTGRQPSIAGQEFTDALAERLSDYGVVVEVWGTLDLQPSAANSGLHAMIGYEIPPVQHYFPAMQVPAIQVFAYPKAHGMGAAQELDDLPELSAFALVGLGTKAARASRYDLAVWAFTRAETGIADAKLGGTNLDTAALLHFVKNSACQVRAQALVDPHYAGALKLLPPQACTGAL